MKFLSHNIFPSLPNELRKSAAEVEKKKFLCLQKSFRKYSAKQFELLHIFFIRIVPAFQSLFYI